MKKKKKEHEEEEEEEEKEGRILSQQETRQLKRHEDSRGRIRYHALSKSDVTKTTS